MTKDLAIIVNTHSSCFDLWDIFFDQFNKFFPNQKIYVFTNKTDGLPDNCIPLIYSESDSYRTQYLKCVRNINEKYSITLNEDYILYDDVNVNEIKYCIDFLEKNPDISFVRLMKGIEYNEPKIADKIYLMDNKNMWFFSQTSTIWQTKDLEKVHEFSPESGMAFKIAGPQLELVANDTCKELNLKGTFYYNGESKRGGAHYDSSIFPHIATACVGGKWNIKEYDKELTPLLKKYNIDINKRGIFI